MSNLKTGNNAFQSPIDHRKLLRGSVKNKIQVRIDNRTLVYIEPGKDKEAIRKKYLEHIYGQRWADFIENEPENHILQLSENQM
jgi:hypothetical protein